LEEKNGNFELNQILEIEGPYRICHMTKNGEIITIKKDKLVKGYIFEIYIPNKENAYKFDKIKEIPLEDNGKIYSMEFSDELLFCISSSKKGIVIDLKTLDIIHILQLSSEIDSPPFVYNRQIYFVPHIKILFKLDYTNIKEIQDLKTLDENTKHPKLYQAKINNKNFTSAYMGFIITDPEKELVFFKNSAIELFKTEKTFFCENAPIKHIEISRLKLTCCGCDLSYVFFRNIF